MNRKMNIAVGLLLAGSVAGFVGSMAHAQEGGGAAPAQATPPAGGRRGGAGATPTNLPTAMSDMGRTLRSLKTGAADPAKAEQALKDIGTLERDVAIAKSNLPPKVSAMTGEEKAKEAAAYRAQLIDLMRTLLDLEEAVAAQKADDISRILPKLDDAEKKGHAEFRSAD